MMKQTYTESMTDRAHARSPYMEFAKLRSEAKYNLASSGIMKYPLAELPVKIEDLEISGPTVYGYPPLLERIAARNSVSPDMVTHAAGTSMANHLAFAATLEPGEEALVEWPTYELLTSTLEYLRVNVRYFNRRMEEGFRVDPEEVERKITPQTRLVVVANLHNPTGVFTDEATLRDVGEIAKKHGARVLVDEVYLETFYQQRPRSAVHFGDHFLITSSLTKAFGLGGLRCGWVLAHPELIDRMRHIHDLYGVNAPHTAELLSVIAFDNLERIAARAKQLLEANRPVLDDFLGSRDDLECVRPKHGTIAFPRLKQGSVEQLNRLSREQYETSIVPGKYFAMEQHFRVGIGGDPEMTREGFARLASALDEISK